MKLFRKTRKLLPVVLLLVTAGLLKAETCGAVASAYITNNGDNTVSVIDTVSQTVGAIPLSGFSGPYGVAIAPAADFLYVTNRGDNTVSKINLQTGLEEARPNAGLDPVGVAVGPGGASVYVVDHASGSSGVTVIHLADLAVDTIAFGTAPFGVAVNPAGTLLYVTDEAANQLHVVNLATKTVTASLTVGNGPHGVAVTPSGSFVVVANSLDNTVSVVNAVSRAVGNPIPVGTGPFGVAITPDSAKAYITNHDDDTVSVVNLTSGSVIATVPVGDDPPTVADGPTGISITHNGKFVYAVNNLTGTVSAIDTATNTVTATFTVGASPVGFGKFIGGPVPAAPTGLQATLVDDTGSNLSWTDNATDESGYKVERKMFVQGGFVTIASLPPDTTSFSDSGLDYNANYYYRVRAFNDEGSSAYSNLSYVTTGAQDYGCFIATAAYGSLLEPHVVLLRGFRDHFLTGNRPGRAFLRFYYENSPPLARFIAAHNVLRFLVRWSLLPLIGLSWLALSIGLLPALLCLVLASTLLAGLGLYYRKSKTS